METLEAVGLCQLCHEREPDEGMKTCWECRRGGQRTEDSVGAVHEPPLHESPVHVPPLHVPPQQHESPQPMTKDGRRVPLCKTCGETDSTRFYASVRNFCRDCHSVRGKASKQARRQWVKDGRRTTEDRGRTTAQGARATVGSLVEEADHAAGTPVAIVVLKVFGREDVVLLERLQELARKERRTVSQQVLFLIQDLIA